MLIRVGCELLLYECPQPTTDGRYLVLPRYTQPDKDQQNFWSRLKLELPDHPPPKIRVHEALNVTG